MGVTLRGVFCVTQPIKDFLSFAQAGDTVTLRAIDGHLTDTEYRPPTHGIDRRPQHQLLAVAARTAFRRPTRAHSTDSHSPGTSTGDQRYDVVQECTLYGHESRSSTRY